MKGKKWFVPALFVLGCGSGGGATGDIALKRNAEECDKCGGDGQAPCESKYDCDVVHNGCEWGKVVCKNQCMTYIECWVV